LPAQARRTNISIYNRFRGDLGLLAAT
jgi:hypothetical protein